MGISAVSAIDVTASVATTFDVKPVRPTRRVRPRKLQRGISIIELMIALVLGMLLSAGIVTLFAGSSKSSRIQSGLSTLQENGRYAMTRIDEDLRMISGQYCANFAGASRQTTNGPQLASRAPWVYASSVTLPDAGAALTYTAGTPFDPRLFVQGYECSTGSCSPALPTSGSTIPDVGTADGDRLTGTDVLTIRYQTGSGWPITTNPGCATGGTITLDPQSGDDLLTATAHQFDNNDLAIVSDCQNPSILPIASAAGNVLTLGTVLTGNGNEPICTIDPNRDTRVFNFTKNFITVTYYIKLVADQDPDAAGRLIPVLVRRLNGVDQEVVQGVDRLDFLYGVDDKDGKVRYLDADEVTNLDPANCPPPPDGVAQLAGCMWRSVASVEVHALLNTVQDNSAVGMERAFRYSIDGSAIGEPATANSAVTNLPFGHMMRREFVSLASTRNRNP